MAWKLKRLYNDVWCSTTTNFKGPNWVIILVCLVSIILVGLYIYQPRNTAACYIFLSRGCSDLENTPAVPSRELTDEETAARVVITEILKSSPAAPKNAKVAFMFFTPGSLPFEMLWDKFFQRFKEDSVRLMKEIVKWSPNCQVLLFFATFNDTVQSFVSKFVQDLFQEYNELYVKKEELPLDPVKQHKVNVPDELSKIMVIKDKIMDLGDKIGQMIIFVKTKKKRMYVT
ncbi:putative RNA helicase [Helianthus debilis subsp. tardiflorus]